MILQYPIKNFPWNYFFINIHGYMMLDIFYQLFKRVVGGTYMLQYLKNIIRAKFKEVYFKLKIMKSLHQANKIILLSKKICHVLFYLTVTDLD